MLPENLAFNWWPDLTDVVSLIVKQPQEYSTHLPQSSAWSATDHMKCEEENQLLIVFLWRVNIYIVVALQQKHKQWTYINSNQNQSACTCDV